ncbi:DUF4227 family protein [Marinicrinis sediminis]|uniref:DUF4227 family protein n=1 Tax=Marinicrinis sediminis TaxID=1652465 RepID=A0ABW5RCN9_9BACL
MIISLRKWMERIQFLLLFVCLTYVFSHVYGWVQDWLDPMDTYRVPEGAAVKAFSTDAGWTEPRHPLERLKQFYLTGE